MTAFVDGGSTFINETENSQLLFDSTLIDKGIDININGDINIYGTGFTFIDLGEVNGIADDGDGNDIIFDDSGNDTIGDGQGTEVIESGQGADAFMKQRNAENDSFGADGDLIFDDQGSVIWDNILNFDDNDDKLRLQDLGLPNGASVRYDPSSGAVIMTDNTSGIEYIIAQMQFGQNITDTGDNNGNFTLE